MVKFVFLVVIELKHNQIKGRVRMNIVQGSSVLKFDIFMIN